MSKCLNLGLLILPKGLNIILKLKSNMIICVLNYYGYEILLHDYLCTLSQRSHVYTVYALVNMYMTTIKRAQVGYGLRLA